MPTRKIKVGLAYFVSSYIHIFHTVEMAAVEKLRSVINERLAAAADEILEVFAQALSAYEEEICRQRRLLDTVLKPQIKLHKTELPQQHVCNEDEVLTDQQLYSQERNSSLDQEDPEPPQIKEEQEELCTSQEEEQLELKQETDVFMVTLTDEESVHSRRTCAKESVGNMPVISVVVSEAQSHLQLISHNSDDSGLTRTADPEINKRHHKTKRNNVNNANLSDMQRNTCTVKNNLKCQTCGKDFKYMSVLRRHMTTHTDEKPCVCVTCEKSFNEMSKLKRHMKFHTAEKKYTCKTCGKKFKLNCDFKRHMRVHTGEKPYVCVTCGKSFNETSKLRRHMRVHTGEKPFTCKACGNNFGHNHGLLIHMRRIHAAKKA
ncbi:zinc finger protein 699-like [Trematomus bernacchii]|uniref:zinc finger protein 699-like n=1 Tax=Trematomus bernacchii TaxID=40690 RepID=UPI00146A0FCE|nr:zinc finger protein 699-like [Trematomus bernacchii]